MRVPSEHRFRLNSFHDFEGRPDVWIPMDGRSIAPIVAPKGVSTIRYLGKVLLSLLRQEGCEALRRPLQTGRRVARAFQPRLLAK